MNTDAKSNETLNVNDDVSNDMEISCIEPSIEEIPTKSSTPSPTTSTISSLITPSSLLTSTSNLNIIRQDQVKIDALLQPNNSSNDSKKRKNSTLSISLLRFVQLIWEIYNDMKIDVAFKKKPEYKKNILSYLEDMEVKRLKLDDDDGMINTTTHENDLYAKDQHTAIKANEKKVIFQHIVLALYAALEQKNFTILFPKEMLKYFLATYSRYITPEDFIDTNQIIKNDRRSKNTGQLINGAILYEYGKSLDSFISNMSRSDSLDIEALKFIITSGIVLPRKMYQLHINLKVAPNEYIIDKNYTPRESHSMILISNFKRVIMLITKNIIMIYDNNQFIIPSTHIEREFNTSLISGVQLASSDYMLFDVLLSTKTKVIDIVQCSLGGKTDLPELYADRLKLITKTFPKIKTVSLSESVANVDISYIQKPNKGFGPAFIYHRSNLTAAVVGTINKHAILAFEDKDNTLVIKTKASILSPVLFTIATAPYKKNVNYENPTIKYNNIDYKIVGDLTNVNLYETVILVECRECNKIAHISHRPLSQVSEYKPMTTSREMQTVETYKRQIENSRDMVSSTIQMLASLIDKMNDQDKSTFESIQQKFGYNE